MVMMMVKMMKVKKIRLIRPEVEVDFKRPFIGRIYFAFVAFPQLIKIMVKPVKIKFNINPFFPDYAGIVRTYRVFFICIPKIKVVKSE